jgi:hypothetical protein
VLRRVFVPKKEGVKGGWRKLYNEELHKCHSFSDIKVIRSKMMR